VDALRSSTPLRWSSRHVKVGPHCGLRACACALWYSEVLGDKETGFTLDHLERVSVVMINARAAQPRKLDGPPRGFSSQRLRELFAAAATGGSGTGESARDPTMDAGKFSGLLRDAGLVGRTLTRDSVDIIFAKAKAVGSVNLHFDEFVSACAAVRLRLRLSAICLSVPCSPALTGSERRSVGSAVAGVLAAARWR